MSETKFTPDDILKEQISDAIYGTRHFLTDKATELAEVVIEGSPMVAAAPAMYAKLKELAESMDKFGLEIIASEIYQLLAAARGEADQSNPQP